MPDPLTVLLDAIWIEAQWWWNRVARGHYEGLLGAWYPEPDSISGRNVFWVSVMEGKE